MVLTKKATDHLKWCSDCWRSWIGFGLPGHGNALELKIRQSSFSKSGKNYQNLKLSTSWKFQAKYSQACFVLVLVKDSISTSVLSFCFALNMEGWLWKEALQWRAYPPSSPEAEERQLGSRRGPACRWPCGAAGPLPHPGVPPFKGSWLPS